MLSKMVHNMVYYVHIRRFLCTNNRSLCNFRFFYLRKPIFLTNFALDFWVGGIMRLYLINKKESNYKQIKQKNEFKNRCACKAGT